MKHRLNLDIKDPNYALLKEIFEKYSIYKKALGYDARIPEKFDSAFRNIGDLNFEGIIADLELLKSK